MTSKLQLWVRSSVYLLGTLLVQIAHAGSFSGATRNLDLTPLGFVNVDAFAVSITGTVAPTALRSAQSDATGQYHIDVGNAERVLLRFSRPGRKTVFLPNLPTALFGGALSGRNDVTNQDVVVPRQDATCFPCGTGFQGHAARLRSFEAGDVLRVLQPQALYIGDRVVAVVGDADELIARDTEGNWIGVSVTRGGHRFGGWIPYYAIIAADSPRRSSEVEVSHARATDSYVEPHQLWPSKDEKPRVWTDRTGERSTTASLVRIEGDRAIFRRADGRFAASKIEFLSALDQAYIATAK